MKASVSKTIASITTILGLVSSTTLLGVTVLVKDNTGKDPYITVALSNQLMQKRISSLPAISYNGQQFSVVCNDANKDTDDPLYPLYNNNFAGGRIYVSFGEFPFTSNPTGNPCDPSVAELRYDWIELTADGAPAACANLSGVNQLGIAMTLESYLKNTKVSYVGYNDSLNTIKNNLYSINQKAFIGGNDTEFVRVISPDNGDTTESQSWSSVCDYEGYLKSLQGQEFEIKGYYCGAKLTDGTVCPPCSYDYTGTFPLDTDKTFTMHATEDSEATGPITITNKDLCETLIEMINKCDGSFTVTDSNQPPNKDAQTVGTNSVYSAIMRDFLVGFNLGFYGYKDGLIDYNNSNNWNPFGTFKNINPNTQTPYGNKYTYTVHKSTNSYSFPFEDFLGKVFVTLNPEKADTLVITILNDTQTGDYTPYSQATAPAVTTGDSQVPQINFFFDASKKGFPFKFNGEQHTVSSSAQVLTSNISANKNQKNRYPVTYRNMSDVLDVTLDASGNITSAEFETGCLQTVQSKPQVLQGRVINIGGF